MSLSQKQGRSYEGTVVADRFAVHERIGSGGMGTVFRAEQTPLGRTVALKLLKDEVAWDTETVTRFHREAKAMSLLQSPHTVRVIDFGQTERGVLFLAMEFLEGETLTKKVQREGVVDPVVAIRIVQQVLASLHEAHTKGIIHRDLKPDNIVLVDVDGQPEPLVKVLDFGIAKVFEGDNDFDSLETQAGTVFGTPRYMSPEQAQGKKLDARSDLYTVGTLLYQLLTGVPPFQDDDAVVVMAQHIRDAPVPPVERVPTQPITAKLNKTVLKAMAKQADKRFQSANEFHDALEACVPGLIDFRTQQTGVFGRVPASRKRSIGIAAAVLMVSLLTALFILLPGEEPVETRRAAASSGAARETETETESPAANETPVQAPIVHTTVTTVRSRPRAYVWRNGLRLGRTPLDIEVNEGETVEIELRGLGYEPLQATLDAGETADFTLERTREDTPERTPRMQAAMATPMAATSMAAGDGYERFEL
ncbi:MAG: serine/threonine-protein kinase [Myxococcota bacterium]